MRDPVQSLLKQIFEAGKVAEMDNRELLWRCMKTPFWKQLCDLPIDDPTVVLVSEVEHRLYPEYNGTDVIFRDWGWETPDGDIRYE